MKRLHSILFLYFLLGASASIAAPFHPGLEGYAEPWSEATGFFGRFHAGLSAGIGLPQIPLSRFRSPISILASATLRFKPTGRFSLKTDATGLTSFYLGTVNGRSGTLKYNLQFLNGSVGYSVKQHRNSAVFVFAGAGHYRVDQRIDQLGDQYRTAGFTLGFESLTQRSAFSTFVGLDWHILFKPSSNPQLMTLTFGLLF